MVEIEKNESQSLIHRYTIPIENGHFFHLTTTPTQLAYSYAEFAHIVTCAEKNLKPLDSDQAYNFFMDQVSFYIEDPLKKCDRNVIGRIAQRKDVDTYDFTVYPLSLVTGLPKRSEIDIGETFSVAHYKHQALEEKIATLQQVLDLVALHEYAHLLQHQLELRPQNYNELAEQAVQEVKQLRLKTIGIGSMGLASMITSCIEPRIGLGLTFTTGVCMISLIHQFFKKNSPILLSRAQYFRLEKQAIDLSTLPVVQNLQNKPFHYTHESG